MLKETKTREKSIQNINDLNCDKGRLCFCVEIQHKTQNYTKHMNRNQVNEKTLLIYEQQKKMNGEQGN